MSQPPQGPYGNQGPENPHVGPNPGSYPQQPPPYQQPPGPNGGPQGAYGQPPQNPNGPHKSSGKKTLWIVLASVVGFLLIVGAVIWVLFAFVFNQNEDDEAQPEPSVTVAPSESPSEDPFQTQDPFETSDPFASSDATEPPDSSGDLSADDLAKAFDERDRFFEEQSHPPGDPSLLSPKTAGQQAFIDEVHDWYKDQGGEDAITPELDHYVLATALNMCEQSILNGHNTSPEQVLIHVQTSPVIKEFASGAAAAEKNEAYDILAAWGVRGTRHICSGDFSDWQAGYEKAAGDWGQ